MLLGSLRKGWHLHPCRKHGRFPFRRRCHWELTKRSTTHGVGCVVFQEPGFLPWHFFLVAPVEWEARHRESSFELFFSAGWVFVTKILGFHTFVSWRRAANSGETAFHTLQRNLRLELLPSNSLWLLMWLIHCFFYICYGWLGHGIWKDREMPTATYDVALPSIESERWNDWIVNCHKSSCPSYISVRKKH